MDLGIDLGTILVGFWDQLDLQIDQKLIKIDVKTHLIRDIVFGFVLGVILVPTWTQPDPQYNMQADVNARGFFLSFCVRPRSVV